MNENPPNKKERNAHKKKTDQPIIMQYEKEFSNESEIIAKYILEKIISLSISETIKNRVNKLIPDFCYTQLYQTLDIITHLDFMSYDKDDYPFKGNKFLKKMKSSKFINNKMTLPLPGEENELLNSEEIRKYKFEKEYDINISNDIDIKIALFENPETEKDEKDKDINKEKILFGILRREVYNEDMNNSFQNEEMKKKDNIKKKKKKNNYDLREDKLNIIKEVYNSVNIPNFEDENEKEPFNINPEEKIEAIQNVESHKLDINTNPSKNTNKNNILEIKKFISIPFEQIIDSKNYWKPLSQPLSAPIDRDAGSKIKFDRPLIPKYNKNSKPIDEGKTINQNKKEDNNINENRKTKLKNTIFFNALNEEKGKKKKIVELPFDSIDIDPNKLIAYKEFDYIAALRDKNEKEIQEKKKEKELLLKIEKEKQSKLEKIEEIRKELYRKKVTVDVKGDIVYIKPIDMRSLIEEFNKGKANFKNIKTVEIEPKYNKDRTSIKVEKNPEVFLNDLKEEKNKKNRKKKAHFQKNGLSNNNTNSSSDLNPKKAVFEKGARFASGSNFDIINPEVGVSITENRKQKSGGKDFYQKYNRFSLEVFQEQLSKTSNSFFPKLTEQNDIINQTNEIKNNINNSKRKKSRRFSNRNMEKIFEYAKKNKTIGNNNILAMNNNNNEKNSLSLKTKNLKIALQDLDLVTEGEMRNLNKTKKLNKTIFLKTILNNTRNKSKKEYNDMDKFAKTLVGKDNWGVGSYTEREQYNNFKIPKKSENIELKRELPTNMLKHMPRKRLPPINSMIKLNTMTGFYTNRNDKKIKEKINQKKENTESKENI